MSGYVGHHSVMLFGQTVARTKHPYILYFSVLKRSGNLGYEFELTLISLLDAWIAPSSSGKHSWRMKWSGLHHRRFEYRRYTGYFWSFWRPVPPAIGVLGGNEEAGKMRQCITGWRQQTLQTLPLYEHLSTSDSASRQQRESDQLRSRIIHTSTIGIGRSCSQLYSLQPQIWNSHTIDWP